jgi:hypothetical protein
MGKGGPADAWIGTARRYIQLYADIAHKRSHRSCSCGLSLTIEHTLKRVGRIGIADSYGIVESPSSSPARNLPQVARLRKDSSRRRRPTPNDSDRYHAVTIAARGSVIAGYSQT